MEKYNRHEVTDDAVTEGLASYINKAMTCKPDTKALKSLQDKHLWQANAKYMTAPKVNIEC